MLEGSAEGASGSNMKDASETAAWLPLLPFWHLLLA